MHIFITLGTHKFQYCSGLSMTNYLKTDIVPYDVVRVLCLNMVNVS